VNDSDHMGRIESLVNALEALPDTAARAAARELVRALLDLHAAGLERVLALAGTDLISRLAEDERVGSLLLLHGLHPHSASDRVNRVLEQARPKLLAIGGDAELTDATENVVRLRLRGDPAAEPELRVEIEKLIVAAAPDVNAIEFEEAWDRPPDGRVPLPLFRGAS
jgi:Fe-S cluster biogenesis protein NfuA